MVWTHAARNERRLGIFFQIEDVAFDPGCGDGEMMTEDGERLFADTQKFIETPRACW